MPATLKVLNEWCQKNKVLHTYILFEGGALSRNDFQRLMKDYEGRLCSLYQREELAGIREYGPWLARIDNATELAAIYREKRAVAGVIFSNAPLTQLAIDLSIGCMAVLPDKREVLLRFYIPRVLRLLACRADMPWHGVLFSEVESWWIREDMDWHLLSISRPQSPPSMLQTLTLDEPLWSMVADRPDVSALLREWRNMKDSHHFPPCVQRKMVEKALNNAREVGLIKPLDQKIYALTWLNGHHDYLRSPEFLRVLERVKKNEITLSDLAQE